MRALKFLHDMNILKGLHAPDIWGGTPLHYACWRGHVKVAKFIMEDALDNDKTPYLHRAHWMQCLDFMGKRMIIEKASIAGFRSQLKKQDLLQFARQASPFGVAVLHGHLRLAQVQTVGRV